jgi:hypothetical protein
VEEKVHAVKTALNQINVASASREAGVLESTLRYDLNKLEQTLPDVLADKPLGPKTDSRQIDRACNSGKQAKAPCACLQCGEKAWNNGTYWVLNWGVMLLMGWLAYKKSDSALAV